MRIHKTNITLETGKGIALHDVTPQLKSIVADSGIRDGFMVITSQHTTTAVTINENEPRLLDDMRLFLHRLVPPADHYLHNDIHLRDCPQDEPENAHSHIAAILLGQSENIPIEDGGLVLGKWQSVMLVELDGSRRRNLAIGVFGDD